MRLPDGTFAQPSLWATSSSYSLELAQAMNFSAASCFLEAACMAQDQVHSQPEDVVSLTGAWAYPILPLTGESSASRAPAADVASYHMAVLLWLMLFRHSVNPACAAPASP